MQQISADRRSAQCARHFRWIAIAAGLCGILASGSARAGLGTAIEYYNPALRHYFITAYPEEAAALDAGTNVKGWTRTGGAVHRVHRAWRGPVRGMPLLRHARQGDQLALLHG